MRKKYKRDKDFTNFRIGNLVLLSRTGDSRLSGRSKDYEWECRCDCGNVCRYFIKRLRHANNVVKSCGICGLTHRKCNSAIALLDENPWIMRLAADYVEAKKWHKEHGELLPLPKELTSKSYY